MLATAPTAGAKANEAVIYTSTHAGPHTQTVHTHTHTHTHTHARVLMRGSEVYSDQ